MFVRVIAVGCSEYFFFIVVVAEVCALSQTTVVCTAGDSRSSARPSLPGPSRGLRRSLHANRTVSFVVRHLISSVCSSPSVLVNKKVRNLLLLENVLLFLSEVDPNQESGRSAKHQWCLLHEMMRFVCNMSCLRQPLSMFPVAEEHGIYF